LAQTLEVQSALRTALMWGKPMVRPKAQLLELRTGSTLGLQSALLTVMLWGRQKAPQWALQLENELAWP